MRYLSILTLLLTILSTSFALEIKDKKTKEVDALIRLGIDQLHDGKYDECLETFKDIQSVIPEHPAGYLFYAAALEWLMVDYRNFTYEKDFMKNIKKAMSLADDMIDANKKDPWGYFYLGGAYGFRGTFYTDFGNIFQAFRDGLKGYKNMEKSIQLKPDLYDAYYGTGLFHFWKAYYSMKFKMSWLSSGIEERDQGIREVRIAMEKGNYVPVEASSSLVRVYYVLERYQDALDLALKITEKYPNYLYCYWYISKCYEALDDTEKQLETYIWLKNYFENTKLSGKVALVEIHYYLGDTLRSMGKYKEAMEYAKKALAHEASIDERVPLQRKYKKLVKKLVSDLEKKLSP